MNVEIRNGSGSLVVVSADTAEQVWHAVEHQLGVLADDRGIEPYGLMIDVDGGTHPADRPKEAGPDVHIHAFSKLPDGRITEFHHDVTQERLSQRLDPAAEVWRQFRLTIVKLQKQIEYKVANMSVSVS
jgi:hypothetical protein